MFVDFFRNSCKVGSKSSTNKISQRIAACFGGGIRSIFFSFWDILGTHRMWVCLKIGTINFTGWSSCMSCFPFKFLLWGMLSGEIREIHGFFTWNLCHVQNGFRRVDTDGPMKIFQYPINIHRFFLETCLLPCSHVRTSNAHSPYMSWYIQGLLSHTHVLWQFPHLLWTFGLRLCCGPHGFFKQVYPPPSISIKTNPMMRNFPMASLDLRRVHSFSENWVYQCLMIHHFPIRNCRLNPQCWTKKMPDYSRFWLVILPLLINIPISSIGSTVGLNISTGQSSYSPQKATKLGGLSHVQNISYIPMFNPTN